MLEILLAWIYIFITSFCTGHLLLTTIKNKLKDNTPVHAALCSLVGLTVIMVVAGYMSFFSPTGLLINLLLSIFSVIYLVINRKLLRINGTNALWPADMMHLGKLFLAAAFVMVLTRAAGNITTPDSAGYHLPFVKWIENYKVIRGIANVHGRFGFNYQYLVLCAVYGFSFLKLQTVHALNGYFMLLLVWYIVGTMRFDAEKSSSYGNPVRLIILFFVLNMNNAVTSFSPDFPATAVIILIILLVLKRLENGTAYRLDTEGCLLFLLTVAAVLVKISALPVFMFSLFVLIPLLRQKRFGPVGVFFLCGVFMILPYLVRNYIISGYLVFPLYSLDLFHVAWKVPLQEVIYQKDVVRSYALGMPYGVKAGFRAEFASWLHYIKISNPVYPVLMLATAGSVLLNAGTIAYLAAKRRLEGNWPYIFTFVILYGCIAFWWINGPDPRFGNGYILPFIAITLTIVFWNRWTKKIFPAVLQVSFGLLTAVLVWVSFGKNISHASQNFAVQGPGYILQQPYPRPDTTIYSTGNKPPYYVVPADKYCWDTPQPCSFCTDHYRYAGSRVEDGFLPAE